MELHDSNRKLADSSDLTTPARPAKKRAGSKSKLSKKAASNINARIDKEPLNDEQRQARDHREGPMVILAGAGSGKTRVITLRIAACIAEGTRPRRIAALTFTNKAADEMEERVDALLKNDVQARPIISTLHSFGANMLRAHADEIGYPLKFEVVSDIEQDEFLDAALRKLPQIITDNIRDQGAQRELLRGTISDWKNNLVGPKDATGDLAAAYAEYQRQLQHSAMLDCDDLIRLPYCLLTESKNASTLLGKWMRKFDYVMVDEFQDTNLAQFRLVQLIVQERQNLVVVGDDDQSIYGWRGADVSLIRSFGSHWDDCKSVALTNNYRSTPEILALSNKLMTHDKERKKKLLRAANPSGAEVVVRSHASEAMEAEWIARVIETSKLPYGSHAIIVRAKVVMPPIVEALQQRGIPYELWKTDDIHIGDEIRSVRALLSTIDDPAASNVAFIRILQHPKFALGEPDFNAIMDRWEGMSCSLWEYVSNDPGKISASGKERLAAVLSYVNEYHERHTKRGKGNSLATIVEDAVIALMPSYTRSDFHKSSGSTRGFAAWMSRELASITTYDRDYSRSTLRKFLGLEKLRKQLMNKPPESMTKTEAKLARRSSVIVATIHAVKGLEFPSVILPSWEQRVLPFYKALENDDGSRLAEERRLANVAITRAKSQLYISYARTRSKRRRSYPTEPSVFLKECGVLNSVDAE